MSLRNRSKIGGYTIVLTSTVIPKWRCSDLMVSALISGSNGPRSSPNRGHCVVFLGKTLNSHSASLHPGVQMGTDEFNAGGNPVMD